MPTNRKKENPSANRAQSVLLPGLILGILLVLALAAIVANVVRSRYNVPNSSNGLSSESEAIYNPNTFKETFLANCTISAKVTLSEATAAKYCGCVLDGGIEKYGTDRFIEINQKITQTYDLSELKDLIDACAAHATTPNS
jgi:hypothetical protein